MHIPGIGSKKSHYVVMFDPLMVMGKPEWTPTESKPGIPAHADAPHPPRGAAIRPRRGVGHRSSRTPQNR